jgi:hypothetical protein
MRMLPWPVVVVLLVTAVGARADHVVVMGGWQSIKLSSGQEIKVRPVVVDGRIKEYSTGPVHAVTPDLFVVRRAYRLNDTLASDAPKPARWTWQLDGWMSVNKSTGHIAELKLPEFDQHNSDVSWFRDYAAYCGAAEDGNVHYMMIFQLGNRKPVLKKELYGQSCAAPIWERDPSRVTFQPAGGTPVKFIVNDSSAELERP